VRWKGIIFLVIVFILFFILSLIFTNIWLEKQFEEVGTALVGAKVEIDDLRFSITQLHLKWTRMQVTNPRSTMRNMIETGETEFDVEVLPLLSDKLIIERIAITDLRTNTPRETDGKVDVKKMAEQDGFIGRTIARLREETVIATTSGIGAIKQKINVDSILKILDIESVDKIQSLNDDLKKKYITWQEKISQLNIEKDAREVENRIKTIDPNKIKSVDGFQSALGNIKTIKTTIDSLQNLVNDTKHNLRNDLSSARSHIGQIDNWVAADYQHAIAKAKIPDINAQNIGKLLFGSNVINSYTQYLGYVGTARSYADKFGGDEPEKKKPPRLKGQDIYFYNKNARPDLWIKEIVLSGETSDALKLSGEIKNIVSDQRQINSTTQFKVVGARSGSTEFNLNGVLNYLEEKPEEIFNISYRGFSLADTKISDSRFLPEKIKRGIGSLESNLTIRGEHMDGVIKFTADQVHFGKSTTQKPGNKAEEIVQSIIDNINMVNFVARIKAVEENLTFSLNSNLDDIFVQRLKGIAGEEVAKAKAKFKNEIDKRVDSYRKQVKNLADEKEKTLTAQVEKYKSMIREKIEMTENKKKEIEERLKKEKSKVTDKLKDVLPFKKK
jgi:uncharacterized protein (TIGR03545 family)